MNFIQMNVNELSRSSGDDPSGDFERVANGTAEVAAASSTNNDTDMGKKKVVEVERLQGHKSEDGGGMVINSNGDNINNDFMQQLQYQQEVMQQQMFAMNNGTSIGGLMGGLSNNMTIPLKNGDDSNNNTTQHIKTMEVDINGAGGSIGQQQPDDSIHRVSGNTTDFEIPDILPPQVENNNSSATASKDTTAPSSTSPPPPQKEKNKRRPSATRKSSPSKSKKNTDDELEIFHGKGSFPLNLTLMLESVHSMELNHIVSWSDSGTSFIMHDPALFLTEVMPKFFKTQKNTKIRSFYRKLNRWGFSILRGGGNGNQSQQQHLTASGLMEGGTTGATRGVWHHPDYYRSRAVACLKMAKETGDTTCFLNVVHATGSSPNASDSAKKSKGKKRRSESGGSDVMSGANSPSLYFGHPSDYDSRSSHRQSDFSIRDEDLNMPLNLDDFVLPQVDASYQAQQAQALQMLAAARTAGQMSAAGGLNNSFTYGMSSSISQGGESAADIAARMMMNKRGRTGGEFNTTSSFSSYQPISSSMGGGMNGNSNGRQQGNMLSASWTAGATNSAQQQLANHNFDFPDMSQMLGVGGQRQQIDGSNNNNMNGDNTLDNLSFLGYQQQQELLQLQQQQLQIQQLQEQNRQMEGGGTQSRGLVRNNSGSLISEDTELANFFEKFAESLKGQEDKP